jgi:hypothetical protein
MIEKNKEEYSKLKKIINIISLLPLMCEMNISQDFYYLMNRKMIKKIIIDDLLYKMIISLFIQIRGYSAFIKNGYFLYRFSIGFNFFFIMFILFIAIYKNVNEYKILNDCKKILCKIIIGNEKLNEDEIHNIISNLCDWINKFNVILCISSLPKINRKRRNAFEDGEFNLDFYDEEKYTNYSEIKKKINNSKEFNANTKYILVIIGFYYSHFIMYFNSVTELNHLEKLDIKLKYKFIFIIINHFFNEINKRKNKNNFYINNSRLIIHEFDTRKILFIK